MFSTDRIMRRGAIALACLAGLGGTALAETMVVRSGGPSARSYPAGKKLAANSKITLVAGDTITVLDSRGTRILRGPGTFSAEASAGAATTNASFTSLITTQTRRRARTGAVRGDGGPTRSPNLWYVDIERAATICVADPANLQLWRRDMQKPLTLTIKDDSGKTGTVAFGAGTMTARWPAALPVSEGASYNLSAPGLAAATRVRFTRFNGPMTDPAETASALLAKGCDVQFDLLVTTLEQARVAG